MTSFNLGPAADKALLIRRHPTYLRIAVDSQGVVDALDQLGDTPRPGEVLYAYRRVSKGGAVHVNAGRHGGGTFRIAVYEYLHAQPPQETLREQPLWEAWARSQAAIANPPDPEGPGIEPLQCDRCPLVWIDASGGKRPGSRSTLIENAKAAGWVERHRFSATRYYCPTCGKAISEREEARSRPKRRTR